MNVIPIGIFSVFLSLTEVLQRWNLKSSYNVVYIWTKARTFLTWTWCFNHLLINTKIQSVSCPELDMYCFLWLTSSSATLSMDWWIKVQNDYQSVGPCNTLCNSLHRHTVVLQGFSLQHNNDPKTPSPTQCPNLNPLRLLVCGNFWTASWCMFVGFHCAWERWGGRWRWCNLWICWTYRQTGVGQSRVGYGP